MTSRLPHVSVTEVVNRLDQSSLMARVKSFVSRHKFVALGAAVVLGGGGIGLRVLFDRFRQRRRQQQQGTSSSSSSSSSEKKSEAGRGRVDRLFLRRLLRIIRVCFPRLIGKETATLGFLSALLVGRTFLSVEIAGRMGAAAKALVSASWPNFVGAVAKIALVSIPASFVNSYLRSITSMMSLRFRRNIVRHIHTKYLSDLTFYKAANLGSHRIDQADQRITQDIDRFCSALSELFTSTFKPILDVILFSKKLASSAGAEGPSIMFLYFFLSGAFLRTITPSFGRLTSQQQNLEGDFRHCHARLIRHSEEVAFYGGSDRERDIINASFDELYSHTKQIFNKQGIMGIFENFFVKYAASVVGYGICAIPVFRPKVAILGDASQQRTEEYVTNTQLLLNLARGIGQLVMLYRRVMTLAGLTTRVAELLELVSSKQSEGEQALELLREADKLAMDQAKNSSIEGESLAVFPERPASVPTPGQRIVGGDSIKFEHVDIITPDRTILARDVNFEMKPGTNWLISGPNGCGKSSLFRVLGGLWPLPCGRVHRPDANNIFYIPQRPYMVRGTLRDQVIYPHSYRMFKESGHTDAELQELMDLVDLSRIPSREGGWDAEKDWEDVFSGGEKQRVAMARLFYHRPIFAILDECTSATSVDVEGHLYETCARKNITLLSISHRPQLRQYHQMNLHFDGTGRAIVRTVDEISEEEVAQS